MFVRIRYDYAFIKISMIIRCFLQFALMEFWLGEFSKKLVKDVKALRGC